MKVLAFFVSSLFVSTIGCIDDQWSFKPVLKDEELIIPIAVIGGGVAGLSAAIYGARAAIPTVVFLGADIGGQLVGSSMVENMPGVARKPGYEIVNDIAQQAANFGAFFLEDTVDSFEKSPLGYCILHTHSGQVYKALSIIIATGTIPCRLNLEHEQDLWGKTIFTCAVCDGLFAKDKDIVVVGTGDTAVDHVLHLAPYARSITMIGILPLITASASMQKKLQQYPDVKVLCNKQILQYMTQKTDAHGLKLTGIMYRDVVTGVVAEYPCAAVYLGMGNKPNTKWCSNMVTLTKTGTIATVGSATSLEGVFAAGDVMNGVYRQAGVAAGQGICAALDAITYLRDHGLTDKMAHACTMAISNSNFFKHR
jgi:thioredoxin reductase (NADPH)